MFSFFTGRSNRQEYWISVGLLIVAAVVLAAFQMQAASAAITIMWIITWVRRLHDIGRPSWVAAIAIAAIFVLVAVGVMLGGKEAIAFIQQTQMSGATVVATRGAEIFAVTILLGLLVQFGFTIWLGVKKGDDGSNKFGPPPNAPAA